MLAWVLYTPLLIVIRKRNSLETPRNQLIYCYNLILLGTRSLNRHTRDYLKQAGQWKKLMQRYKSRKGKAEKSKDTKIQHTVQKIMPGENCAIVGCSTNRRHKDISLFELPTAKPCLLLRLNFRSARGASCHPAFMGNCQTSHTPHSPTYPVDEGSEV